MKKVLNCKKLFLIGLLILAILAVQASQLFAEEVKTTMETKANQEPVKTVPEEDKVTGEIDLNVLSAYIWRGQELSRGSVVVQLAVTASYLLSIDETTYAKYDGNSVASMTDKYNNFHDGTVTVSLPIAVYKTLSITPTASYVFPLCDDVRYEMRYYGKRGTNPSDRDSSYLYGGVTLSYTF
jgi:hypothetical protein